MGHTDNFGKVYTDDTGLQAITIFTVWEHFQMKERRATAICFAFHSFDSPVITARGCPTSGRQHMVQQHLRHKHTSVLSAHSRN
jgi:hypothetical protein